MIHNYGYNHYNCNTLLYCNLQDWFIINIDSFNMIGSNIPHPIKNRHEKIKWMISIVFSMLQHLLTKSPTERTIKVIKQIPWFFLSIMNKIRLQIFQILTYLDVLLWCVNVKNSVWAEVLYFLGSKQHNSYYLCDFSYFL